MIPCLPIQFVGDSLKLLDQRKLPLLEEFIECQSPEEVHKAIRDMAVRGAPCIGFCGIYGLALAAMRMNESYSFKKLEQKGDFLKTARPTAVNLAYEIDRALELVKTTASNQKAFARLKTFADRQIAQSEINNRAMAAFAIADLDKRLSKQKYRLLTHCNTGFLACGSIGTALGVIQQLGEKNRVSNVFVDETRPYLQGARLTAFELGKLGIPHQVVVEGAASYIMRKGEVDAIFVGADRIVRNGDTANKVGTSNLAIVAKEYNVPFYVVAPKSTFDHSLEEGSSIEIELRDEEEVLNIGGARVAPYSTKALNPSFDITGHKFITAIVCEAGVALPPFRESIERFFT